MDIIFLYLIVSAAVCCLGLIYFFYGEGNSKMIIFLKILLIILLFFLPKLHDGGISDKLETINLITIITLDLVIGYFMRKKRRREFKEKMEKRKMYEQKSDYLCGFEDAIDDLL